ncbi:MAG: benzoyl-CoA reductase subunit A [Proteobacteria bacterium]|nr:benzoyl-CoA reductase subunit A [Pseudomonadota bacterium]
MRTVIGIDLGSTTTKAVIRDEDGRTVGRGITNSRSNYDVACAVARTEAMNQARMRLLADAIGEDDELAGRAEPLARSLDRAFRHEQHNAQLDELRKQCEVAADSGRAAERTDLGSVLDTIFDQLKVDAERMFAPLAESRSDFFRDMAGSGYQAKAEQIADPETLPFDLLLGLYDQAILKVENAPGDLSLEALGAASLKRMLSKRGDSDRVREPLSAALRRAMAQDIEVMCEVGTGYGRVRLPFPKEQIRSEILCHGLGAHMMFPGTRTVLDIGGQDTKAIQVDDQGIVTSFQMNDRCAAGCGRYLGYIADEMNLGLHELGPLAMEGTKEVRINSTCTVFAGAELRDRLSLGEKREDILLGLHRAIVLRAMSLVARSGGIDNQFTWTGGVARNPAAVQALKMLVRENYGDEIEINIDPSSIYTGALGAAEFATRLAGEA